jgi:hypothetical protein
MLMYFFYETKPWPIIERFLQSLEPGSVGLDVGCGNGKYLAVNRDVFIVGSDRYVALRFPEREKKRKEKKKKGKEREIEEYQHASHDLSSFRAQ